MDHNRRHDRPESEAKKLTPHDKINMQKFKIICTGFSHALLSSPMPHRGYIKSLLSISAYRVSFYKKNTELETFTMLTVNRRKLSHLSNTILKNDLGEKCPGSCILGINRKNMKGYPGSMADCLSQQGRRVVRNYFFLFLNQDIKGERVRIIE